MDLTVQRQKQCHGNKFRKILSVSSALASGQGDDGSILSVLILLCDLELGVGWAFGKSRTLLWKLWFRSFIYTLLNSKRGTHSEVLGP